MAPDRMDPEFSTSTFATAKSAEQIRTPNHGNNQTIRSSFFGGIRNLFHQASSTETSGTNKVRQSYHHMAGHALTQQNTGVILEEWTPMRITAYNIIEHALYATFMGIIIITNAVFVIHETDLRASDDEIPAWLMISGYTFLTVYFLEIVLRFYIFRLKFFASGWNCIDLMVVITDCCAECSRVWADTDVPSVAVLRIFRLVRLMRLIAMLTVFQELQTMLLGFASAMKAMLWASFLIGVVLTTCSIFAVEFISPLNVKVAQAGAYGHCERCGRAFETVATSNLTFIQQIIAGDSWGQITVPIVEAYPATGIFFFVVFGLIDLGVLNLILTVIVNAAEEARLTNKVLQLRAKEEQTQESKNRMTMLLADIDTDNDGRISLEEFMAGVDGNAELRETLALLDIQRQDVDLVYHLMDEDDSGDVDYNEFIHTMMETKHENLNTKLLWLKGKMNDSMRLIREQTRVIKADVVNGMIGTPDVSRAVRSAVKESLGNVGLDPDTIMSEFTALNQKITERWDMVQIEQAKSLRVLEKVRAEVVSSQSVVHALEVRPMGSKQSSLPSLSMPQCSSCEVADKSLIDARAMVEVTPEARREVTGPQ